MMPITLPDDQWEKLYQFLLSCSNIYVHNEAATRFDSSKLCCGWLVAVPNGGFCQPPMAIGTPFTSGLPGGVIKGSSHRCTNTSSLTPIWSRLLLTVPFAGLIRVRLAHLKKKGGTENQALGRSRGGFSTKIHITVDGLGNPLRMHLTPGQRNDIVEAEALIIGYNSTYVIGDKGYDSDDFIDVIEANGATAVIPPRSNRVHQRTYDEHLYKERHLVECFINKMKWYRRIFSRFEKLATRYFGFLSFVSSLIWLR